MRYLLEFDDFHFAQEVNCLDTIKELVNEFPNILINLFTIPYYKNQPIFYNDEWCNEVRSLIKSNNIRIAIHGTYHTQEEYKHYDYQTAVTNLKLGESALNAARIDFVKVFRGPHWGLCKASADAICDLGYTHLYSHKNYADLNKEISTRIKVPIYNWNLCDEYPNFESPIKNETPCIIHGHTHNVCGNGISETCGKIKGFIEKYNPIFLGVNEW